MHPMKKTSLDMALMRRQTSVLSHLRSDPVVSRHTTRTGKVGTSQGMPFSTVYERVIR